MPKITAIEATCGDIDGMKFELSNQDDKIKSLETQTAEYNTKLSSVEAQLQKDKLRFYGIIPHGETPIDSIKHFLTESLNLPADIVAGIEISHCFRIGGLDTLNATDRRTILAKFLRSADVFMIMIAARKKRPQVGCKKISP